MATAIALIITSHFSSSLGCVMSMRQLFNNKPNDVELYNQI